MSSTRCSYLIPHISPSHPTLKKSPPRSLRSLEKNNATSQPRSIYLYCANFSIPRKLLCILSRSLSSAFCGSCRSNKSFPKSSVNYEAFPPLPAPSPRRHRCTATAKDKLFQRRYYRRYTSAIWLAYNVCLLFSSGLPLARSSSRRR